MILDINLIENMATNKTLLDIYISHRVKGETFREIAKRYGVHHGTIFDKWIRACHHIADELKRELARTEYQLGKYRTKGTAEWGNVPSNLFYVNGTTNKDTFSIPSIRPFVLAHCHGLVFNAFAGITPLERDGCQFVTNDLNPECPTNFHLDCSSLGFVGAVQECGINAFDTILVDPPFSLYLAKRKYNGRWFRDYTIVKNNIDKLAKIGTKVITLGFNSTGFGAMRGYEKLEVLIVNAKGNHNDILVTVERKVRVVETPEETFEVEVLDDHG